MVNKILIGLGRVKPIDNFCRVKTENGTDITGFFTKSGYQNRDENLSIVVRVKPMHRLICLFSGLVALLVPVNASALAPATPLPMRQAYIQTIAAERTEAADAMRFRMGPVFADGAVAIAALGFQENLTGKAVRQLAALKDAGASFGDIAVSGYFGGALMLEHSNTPGKFPILSRFPTQHGSDTFGSRFVVTNAAIGITGSLGDYGFVYLQPEYSEVEFSGDQSEFQLRQAYAVFGNLEKFPVYAAFGRKTVEFGDFDSLNPFTHSINTHFFWAVSDAPVLEVGLVTGFGFEATATAINGGRQLRVLDAGDDGNIANFAVKLKQTVTLNNDIVVSGSVSYLNDSIYRNNFTNHTAACLMRGAAPNCGEFPDIFLERRNGVVDATLEIFNDRFDLQASYTTTVRDWLATDHRVSALTIQGRYKTALLGRPFWLSGVYSKANIGPSGSEFDFAEQHVIGADWQFAPGVWLGSEVVYNRGFQPLINIQLISDQSVESWTSVTGVKVWF